MDPSRWLEQKMTVRLSGVALLLTPAVNAFARLAWQSEIPNRWTLSMFWKFVVAPSTAHLFLAALGVVIGIVLCGGSAKNWKYVLLLLGGHLSLQLTHFKNEVSGNWISISFFLINLSLFSFIAYHFAWKLGENPQSPRGRWKQLWSRRKFQIDFAGVGPWARLKTVSHEGFTVVSDRALPFDLKSRSIEICLQKGLILKAQLDHQVGTEFFFKYLNLSLQQTQLLNAWFQKQQSASES